jgi:hypothetical protein
MICILHGLLMKELTTPVFGDDLHCVILVCEPVKSMLEYFAYDRAL